MHHTNEERDEDEDGREEDGEGRNVRFGFPTDQEEEEDDHHHLSLPPSLPRPSTETEEEGREGGQVSWVRERYLRLFPHVQVPTERGSGAMSPIGLVRREGGRKG